MTAAELYATLQAAGFTLSRDGDRLGVSPREALTQELRAAIVEHKDGLLALLGAASAPPQLSTRLPVSLWWDAPPWNGIISDGEHWRIVNADIREHGYYRPDRRYPTHATGTEHASR